jgi:hypothetical protein
MSDLAAAQHYYLGNRQPSKTTLPNGLPAAQPAMMK